MLSPTLRIVLICVMGGCFGLGLFMAADAARKAYLDKRDLPGNAKTDESPPVDVDPKRLAVALVVGLLVAVVLGWPLVAVVVAAATYAAPVFFARSGVRDFGDRTEAVAVWVESVRDSMGASQGLQGAIRSGSTDGPQIIREDLDRFLAELDHGSEMAVALGALAGRLSHPISDQAIATLILAVQAGAVGVRDVLNDVADTSREMAANMGEIHASRARAMMTLRLVIAAIGIFTFLFVITSRDYLSVYTTLVGQLVLTFVLAVIGANLYWIYRLSRHDAPTRPIRPERLVATR